MLRCIIAFSMEALLCCYCTLSSSSSSSCSCVVMQDLVLEKIPACLQFGPEKAETVSGTESMPEEYRWAKNGRGGSPVLVFSRSLVALLPVAWYVMTSPTRPPRHSWSCRFEEKHGRHAWTDGDLPSLLTGVAAGRCASPAPTEWKAGDSREGERESRMGQDPEIGPNWMWPSCCWSPRTPLDLESGLIECNRPLLFYKFGAAKPLAHSRICHLTIN